MKSRLKVYLEKNKVLHLDLAKRINRKSSTVSDIVNCKTRPSLEVAHLIEDFTKKCVTTEMLLDDYKKRNPSKN